MSRPPRTCGLCARPLFVRRRGRRRHRPRTRVAPAPRESARSVGLGPRRARGCTQGAEHRALALSPRSRGSAVELPDQPGDVAEHGVRSLRRALRRRHDVSARVPESRARRSSRRCPTSRPSGNRRAGRSHLRHAPRLTSTPARAPRRQPSRARFGRRPHIVGAQHAARGRRHRASQRDAQRIARPRAELSVGAARLCLGRLPLADMQLRDPHAVGRRDDRRDDAP